jgi:hypothetical protein
MWIESSQLQSSSTVTREHVTIQLHSDIMQSSSSLQTVHTTTATIPDMSMTRSAAMTMWYAGRAGRAYSIYGDLASFLSAGVSHMRLSRLDFIVRQQSLSNQSARPCSRFASVQHKLSPCFKPVDHGDWVLQASCGTPYAGSFFTPAKTWHSAIHVSTFFFALMERFGHLSSWQDVSRHKKTDTCPPGSSSHHHQSPTDQL